MSEKRLCISRCEGYEVRIDEDRVKRLKHGSTDTQGTAPGGAEGAIRRTIV